VTTTDDPIVEIAESVFRTMLGMEITPAAAIWIPNPEGLVALVHVTGSWNGAVALETTSTQACNFAGAFLSLPAPDSVDGDVRDVIGELANMIGGNLKSTLAHGTSLSSPSVADGGGKEIMPRDGIVARQAFSGDCGLFWISRITQDPKR
jgi:chemotaxis protein CheX